MAATSTTSTGQHAQRAARGRDQRHRVRGAVRRRVPDDHGHARRRRVEQRVAEVFPRQRKPTDARDRRVDLRGRPARLPAVPRRPAGAPPQCVARWRVGRDRRRSRAGSRSSARWWCSPSAKASVAAGVQFGDNPVPRDADIMRTLTSVGFGAMLVFGAASAGLLVITTSVAGGRAGLLSRWLAVTGYVVGVIVHRRRLDLLPVRAVRALGAGGQHRHAPGLGRGGRSLSLTPPIAWGRGGSGSGRGAVPRRPATS